MMNIRDFFVPEKPGAYAALYLGNYSVDTLLDKNGNSIDQAHFTANRDIGPIQAGTSFDANLDVSVEMYAIAPTFMWNTGFQVFGADYAMLLSLPFANTSVGASLDTLTNITLGQQSFSTYRRCLAGDRSIGL
jgi:hypothetical protein